MTKKYLTIRAAALLGFALCSFPAAAFAEGRSPAGNVTVDTTAASQPPFEGAAPVTQQADSIQPVTDARDEDAAEVADKGIPSLSHYALQSDGGKLWHLELSTTLVRSRTKRHPAREILVYTPPDYDSPDHARDRYPVLYLLHGSPGRPSDFINYGDWLTLLEKARRDSFPEGAMEPSLVPRQNSSGGGFILVMPDGNYAGEKHGDSEWANSADRRDLFEDFVTRDVVEWTDRSFRTIPRPESRWIGGVSEGGYGAVNLALRHPNLYGGVVALSGYYNNGGYGWARKIMGKNNELLHDNDPLGYLDTGLGAGRTAAEWRSIRFFLGAGADEKRYTTETEELSAKLTSLGVRNTVVLEQGKHGWSLWRQLFYEGMLHTMRDQASTGNTIGPAPAQSRAGGRTLTGHGVPQSGAGTLAGRGQSRSSAELPESLREHIQPPATSISKSP